MHSSSFIGSSPLVRLLDPWSPVEAEAPGPDVAERMSLWFGPLDAIRLQAMHQAVAAAGEERKSPKAGEKKAPPVAEDLQRVRGVLAKAISQDPLALAGLKPDATEDPGYGPFHQRHIELQRQMGQMAGALRDHVRQAVARVSPRLRQLAVLDASLEELMAAREQALLPTTALLLERRFSQLRAAHRQVLETTGEPDDPTHWRRPGGWLATFANDWRNALLAELDLRLEPVSGLVDALRNEPLTPQA